MMTVRILHTADLHLGANLAGFGELARERQRDFEKTFERIVTLAIKREADCLVVAGDLFDSNNVSAELVGRVQEGFARLAGRGIAVVLIPGTHDHVVGATSIYRRYPFNGVHLLMEPVVTEPLCITLRGEEVWFYGFAYNSASSNGALSSMERRSAEGIHIGLLHGSLRGSPEWEHRHKDLPFAVADLAALGLDYVALGHYHSFAPVEHDGQTIACYPGSPEGKRFGENGARHVVITEVAKGRVTLEKVEVQSRTISELSIDASLFADQQPLVEELTRLASPEVIARVRLVGIVEEPLDCANMAGRLQGLFAWLDLVDETDLFDSSYVQRLEREDSIRGLFVRKVQERCARAASDEERELHREALKLVFKRFAGRTE
ncbi:MAG TPA: DNA repair exonuclease [Geobacteraceae bacterium]